MIGGLEMNPLGPFNSKSVATTISPWIITVDAMEPFQTKILVKDSSAAAYLKCEGGRAHYAVNLRADLIEQSGSVTVLCNTRLDLLHWSFKDMIAHQTINGCALRSGDMRATGTISGGEDGMLGCLLEITKGGAKPFCVKSDTKRTYLEDGDAIRLTGWAGDLGSDSCVGFGENIGVMDPAISWDEYTSM
jgi:fumarylacetoacetase